MKSSLKIFLLLGLIALTLEKTLEKPLRKNQDDEDDEEEEEYEEEGDYTPIDTYQRRSVRIGTERGSLYKVFKYEINPMKDKDAELVIDLYMRVMQNVKMYIYTDFEDIYLEPKDGEFKDFELDYELFGVDQVIIKDEDFLEKQNDIYIVFSATEVENFRTYVTINLINELYEIYSLFRYTYFNDQARTYYYHLEGFDEKKNMYIQFQSLANDPKCSIKISEDEDFEETILNSNINEIQYENRISLKKGQEYYIQLTLDRETKQKHGFSFDVAFTFSNLNVDKTIVTTFEDGYSDEVPIVVSQSVYFFLKVSDFKSDNIILRGNMIPTKIKSYAYQYYDTNSPEDAAEEIKDNKYTELEEENDFTSVGPDIYIKIPDNNKKVLGFRVEFNATSLNPWDTIERFYVIKVMSDPIEIQKTSLEKETLIYIKPNDFQNGNVLILSTSAVETITFVDFKKSDSDQEYLEYINSYKGQFYIFDKKTLPKELLLIINEEESYVELNYQFFSDVEILSNNFDSYGRLFSLDDCEKTYLMFSQENEYRNPEDQTYIYFRRVYGDAQVFFGKIYEYNNDINALFSSKYVLDNVKIYSANEEFFVKLTCELPTAIHLIYFDSTDTFSADTGNFYPIYLDPKLKPYDERTLEMVSRRINFELELIRDFSQFNQSFSFEFQNREFDINLKNPKILLKSTLVEDESLEFSNIKGKNLVFFKIDLDRDEFERYEKNTTLTRTPDKVLIFPFEDRYMIQTFSLKNRNDRPILICVYNDYSAVYIHPKGGSCFYLYEGEEKVLKFQFGNLFRTWSMVGDEEYYTVFYIDDEITLDYKIEEGEDPGYHDWEEYDEDEDGEYEDEEYEEGSNGKISKGFMNTMIFLFLIILCIGILIILRITKFQDTSSDLARYSLDGGIN